MKKLATLLLAAGLVFGAATGASAIDFKAKGQWIMGFDYGDGGAGFSEAGGNNKYGFNGGSDNFDATQRVRLQVQAIASETLSGTVFFEIGNSDWGTASSGGALGADQRIIELKQAYIDWVVPNTQLKVRMGIQGLALPSFTADTQVFSQDVAGIVLSNTFNDNFTLTAFWARPFNDNFAGDNDGMLYDDSSANFMDNADVFGLILPMTFDGFKVTPWATYMAVGKNVVRAGAANGGQGARTLNGVLPAGAFDAASGDAAVFNELSSYGNVWHLGVTGEVTMADPFRIAWDFNYGSSDFGTIDGGFGVDDYEVKRSGFYGSLLGEYKMEWGTPGLYFWYSTGDDGNASNGSERMPVINVNNGTNRFSNFASHGGPYIPRESVIGDSLIGTWGIGARVKDFSFVEDLSHTFRINYFGGTNSTAMVAGFNGDSSYPFSAGSENAIYLTHKDYALEFGLSTDYQIYENLNLFVDAAYLVLDMNRDVWGKDYTATDAWNINASFVYSF